MNGALRRARFAGALHRLRSLLARNVIFRNQGPAIEFTPVMAGSAQYAPLRTRCIDGLPA